MDTRTRVIAVLLLGAAVMPWPVHAEENVAVTSFATANNAPVPYIISPQATDPSIKEFTDPTLNQTHYVWPPLSRAPGSVDNSLLYVFLPATGAQPSGYQLIEQEAARLGYHVIGLMYPNKDTVVGTCNPLPDAQRESCYEDLRLQTLDGVNRSYTSVDPANSIYNRLTKLLVYLAQTHPGEGWDGFLDNGEPNWSRIVVAGHSQGGGDAALIGKQHLVARVVMISSPPDGCFDSTGLPQPSLPGCSGSVDAPADSFDAPANWTTEHGATPADRYYGLAHQNEFAIRPMLANWKALGLDAFGAPVTPETSSPPYNCTHILLTALPHPFPDSPSNPVSLQDHRLTARDTYTPMVTLTDGSTVPVLRDAWRYISAVSPGATGGCGSGSSVQ